MTAIAEEPMESYARNTRRAYAGQWAQFLGWLEADGRPTSLPIDPELIQQYLRHKTAMGRSVNTLGQICKAIDCYHDNTNLPKPCSIPAVKKTLKILRRQARHAPRQAHPLTVEHLQAIVTTATRRRPFGPGKMETEKRARRRGLVDVALIRTMRDAQLRRGEVEALKWSDIETQDHGAGLLTIPFSKTDQNGQGSIQYLSADTMKALNRIKKFRGRHEVVFGLCAAQISRRIKAACNAAGLDDNYSGHSPRVGMTLDQVRSDISLAAIQQAGRWKTPAMVQHYSRGEVAQRGATARFYEKQKKGATA